MQLNLYERDEKQIIRQKLFLFVERCCLFTDHSFHSYVTNIFLSLRQCFFFFRYVLLLLLDKIICVIIDQKANLLNDTLSLEYLQIVESCLRYRQENRKKLNCSNPLRIYFEVTNLKKYVSKLFNLELSEILFILIQRCLQVFVSITR